MLLGRCAKFLCALLFVGPLLAGQAASQVPAPLLLISLDGFRWDYCERHPDETPTLRRLKAEGASARGLVPVFPSNTFPNHYSIATGLRPGHHGIVNNDFFDPTVGRFFHFGQPSCNHEERWWGGEPIWITAVRQNRASACYFWPGSEVELRGLRPTFWKPYDYSVSFAQRLEELVGWLKLPVRQRPAVVTFYLEETNSVGHASGPESPELAAAVKLLDSRVGAILARAAAEQIPLNVVVVSDHGMTSLSAERVVILDDYLDLATVQVDFDGSAAGLRPLDGDVEALVQKLAKLPPEAKAYRNHDLPAHLAVVDSPREPPVWILASEGWHVEQRSRFNAKRSHYSKGEHGYDPSLASMRGILIVHGPVFKTGGLVIEPVENIHIYNLLCAAIGLQASPNDGDDRLVRAFIAR
jgi:predicted AlkP superfamily pyrophosphatase or phosphodiesterase